MGADILQPGVDIADPVTVGGGVGLFEQLRPLGVLRQHPVDEAGFALGRLLPHHALARALGHGDGAAFGLQLAGDDFQQGGLAAAIAPHQPDLVAGRDRGAGLVKQGARADTPGDIVNMQHQGSLAWQMPIRRLFTCSHAGP